MRRTIVALAVVLAGCTEGAVVLSRIDAGAGPEDAALARDGGGADARVDVDGGPIVGVKDVSGGGAHSCAVLGGLLACWGDGSEGALGIGASGDRLDPVRVGAAADWTEVVAAQGATCGLRASAGLLCWGANDSGQLGLGDRTPRFVPTPVPLPGVPARVRASRAHACAILDDGALLCWGANFEGQLGRADPYPGEDGLTPAPVASALAFREVCTGQGHSCAIAEDGSLWCWGRNTDAQLGLGAGSPIQVRAPARVGAESDWASIACGQGHSCGLRADGTLWCWGVDFAGQIGIALGTRFDRPAQVGGDAGWARISTYVFHTCGVRDDGSLWCWGRNVEGQLGVGDTRDREAPARVDDRNDWARVSAGWFHTCAQRRDGSVWCTGENGDGRLGAGDASRRDRFELVSGVSVE